MTTALAIRNAIRKRHGPCSPMIRNARSTHWSQMYVGGGPATTTATWSYDFPQKLHLTVSGSGMVFFEPRFRQESRGQELSGLRSSGIGLVPQIGTSGLLMARP